MYVCMYVGTVENEGKRQLCNLDPHSQAHPDSLTW